MFAKNIIIIILVLIILRGSNRGDTCAPRKKRVTRRRQSFAAPPQSAISRPTAGNAIKWRVKVPPVDKGELPGKGHLKEPPLRNSSAADDRRVLSLIVVA